MNLFSSIAPLILVASFLDVCKGDGIMWHMGSYESNDIQVGESMTFMCGSNEIPTEFQDRAALVKCDTSRAMTVDDTNGDGLRTLTFTEAGIRYFGCTMNNNCMQSTKLTVTIRPKGTAPKTYGAKKFVITKGARCNKAKVVGIIKNKYALTCLFICRKTKGCHGFMHKAYNDQCILYGERTYPNRKTGNTACGWRVTYPDDSDNANAEDTSHDSITVNVFLSRDSKTGGKALLKLYLYDKKLADVPAALVTEHLVQVPPGARTFPAPVKFFIDPSVTQVGNTFEEMVDGAYYVALDSGESDLTYSYGPVFDISPNQTVTFLLKNEE